MSAGRYAEPLGHNERNSVVLDAQVGHKRANLVDDLHALRAEIAAREAALAVLKVNEAFLAESLADNPVIAP